MFGSEDVGEDDPQEEPEVTPRGTYTRDVLFVHSMPSVLCPHIEWVVSTALGQEVYFQWIAQDAASGMVRSEFSWAGPAGSGARLASALRGWEHLRYEVTKEVSPHNDGRRWSHMPSLGIFHSQMDTVGSMVVPEDRIRAALEGTSSLEELREGLDLALGVAWDEELEPFRHAGAGAPVRWLNNRVGRDGVDRGATRISTHV